ncbi:MAG: hypothetical protein AAF449_10540 [Myxococcota bacterium]
MLIALASACASDTEVVQVTLPDTVTVVGLLGFDAESRFVKGASLQPWTDSLSVVSPVDRRTLLIGFTDQQLQPYVNVLSPSDTLRPAVGCENHLPPAVFAAWWTPEGLEVVDPSTLPDFTNDTVTTSCSTVVDLDWAVDDTCYDERCFPAVSGVGPCSVELDLSACDGGRIIATVDANGEVCATIQDRETRCDAVDDEYSDQSFSCPSAERMCPVHLYTDARARPMPFTVARGRWIVGENRRPGVLGERAWIGLNHVRSGYAYGMTVLDDRVVVSGAVDADGCSEAASRLTFIDPDSLDTVLSVNAYSCVQALSTDPSGSTFVAAYYDNGWRVGRFDRTGDELVRGPPIGPQFGGTRSSGARQVPNWRAAEILRPVDAGDLWLIMYDSRGAEPALGTTAWVRLDARTLAPVSSPQFLEPWFRSYAGSLGPDGSYALLDDWSFSVGWFGSDSSTPMASVSVGPDSPFKNVYYDLRPISEQRMLVALQGRAPALTVTPMGQIRRMTHPAGEREQVMMTFLPWAGSIQLGLGIQTVDRGNREVIATLIDPSNDRFLPGVWVIGEGMPSFVRTDVRGRYFIILPWTAEIVRLDP